MDYSLLLGIHDLDQAAEDVLEVVEEEEEDEEYDSAGSAGTGLGECFVNRNILIPMCHF